MAAKKRGLGRGLDALLNRDGDADDSAKNEEALRQLPIEQLRAGRYQPRSHFDADALAELAESIKAQGVIQPVVVRPLGANQFEIIAGERRWRAAQQAGLRDIPCVVRDSDDNAVLAMALIENIQREDLNPLEEATALKRLVDEFDLTHQQAATAVGRSRAAVSNLLRLLELPASIRKLVDERQLEMGHARALLTLPPAQAEALAREAAAGGWSVREVERRVTAIMKGAADGGTPASKATPRDANIDALERELAELLNTPVSVQHGRGGRGKLVLNYHSLDELEGILERLRR